MLDRTGFFHHATFTNNHANLPKVLRLMGQTAKQEMLPSIFAKYLAPCFGTVQVDPVSAGAGDVLSIDGRSLPNVAPTGPARSAHPAQQPAARGCRPCATPASTRSTRMLKERGTKAQQRYLDSLALSRQQAAVAGQRPAGHAGGHHAATAPTARSRRRWR